MRYPDGYPIPRVSELPESQREPFSRFLEGRPRPQVKGVADTFHYADYFEWLDLNPHEITKGTVPCQQATR